MYKPGASFGLRCEWDDASLADRRHQPHLYKASNCCLLGTLKDLSANQQLLSRYSEANSLFAGQCSKC